MSDFNPLGNFVPTEAIDPQVVVWARDFADTLPTVPDGAFQAGYWHWTAGHYGMDFPDYNGAIGVRNGHIFIDSPHDPRDNALGVNDNAPAAHTWLRNTGAFGFAVDCMSDGGVHNFGTEPPTVELLIHLCAGSAAVSKKYNLNVMGTKSGSAYEGGIYEGEPVWLTHAECAVRGGNPPNPAWYNYGIGGTVERWDLAIFVALPSDLSLTLDMAKACGDALRMYTHRVKALM